MFFLNNSLLICSTAHSQPLFVLFGFVLSCFSFFQAKKWKRDGFGLEGGHTNGFFPLAVTGVDADLNSGCAHPGCARARHAASTGECPSIVDVEIRSGGLIGANLRVVFAKKKKQPATAAAASSVDYEPNTSTIHHDHCALLAFAYLAAQPEVTRAHSA